MEKTTQEKRMFHETRRNKQRMEENGYKVTSVNYETGLIEANRWVGRGKRRFLESVKMVANPKN